MAMVVDLACSRVSDSSHLAVRRIEVAWWVEHCNTVEDAFAADWDLLMAQSHSANSWGIRVAT